MSLKSPSYDAGFRADQHGGQIVSQYQNLVANHYREHVTHQDIIPLPYSLLWFAIHQTIYFEYWASDYPRFDQQLLPIGRVYGPGARFKFDGNDTVFNRGRQYCIVESDGSGGILFYLNESHRNTQYDKYTDNYLRIKIREKSSEACEMLIDRFWFSKEPRNPITNLMLSKKPKLNTSGKMYEKYVPFFKNVVNKLYFVAHCIDKYGYVPGAFDMRYEWNNDPYHSPGTVRFDDFEQFGSLPEPGSPISRRSSVGYIRSDDSSISDTECKKTRRIMVGRKYSNVPTHYICHFFKNHGDRIDLDGRFHDATELVILTSDAPDPLYKFDPNQPDFFRPYLITGLSMEDAYDVKSYVQEGEVLGADSSGRSIVAPVSGFPSLNHGERGGILIWKAQDPASI